MPLADVEQIWTQAEVPGERTVLVPWARDGLLLPGTAVR